MNKNKDIKCVILAGGHGTRLWPLSQRAKPKQFQAIGSEYTMLQDTVNRMIKKFAIEDIYIATNARYVDEVAQEIPNLPARNIIAEPEMCGTASAFALILAIIRSHSPEALIACFPADHIVKHPEGLLNAITHAGDHIANNPNTIVTFGIVPDYPETGYGYIKRNGDYNDANTVHTVESFIEKPDQEKAKQFIQDGYLWNAGMFMFNSVSMSEQFEKHLPDTHKRLLKIQEAVSTDNFNEVLQKEYPKMEDISIDYGILERAENIAVIPLEIGWNDIGTWASLKDTLTKKGDEHFAQGEHHDFGSKNLLVYGKKKIIVTAGIKDIIIVDTDDALLVCHRDESQNISKIAKQIMNK